MKELMIKYAKVLLDTCLKVDKDQPLFINVDPERLDFVRIISKIAYEKGITDIHLELIDPYLKHDALLNLGVEELKRTHYFNKKIWDTYAKKGAAFLMLASVNPGLMKDVDQKKLSELTAYSYKTRKYFDKEREKARISWCIAAVPTLAWAKTIFPNSKNDMSTVCMERCMSMCAGNGFMAMINIPVWMFLSGYEKLRIKQLNNNTYVNMVHPGRGIFGSDFGTTSFVLLKKHIAGYKGVYRRAMFSFP